EDGIRDFHVTGVQTCALPILFFFDGAWHVVQDWTPSPAIDGADTSPCVSVFVEGSTFRVYFNGRAVGTITDVQVFAREGSFGIRSEERRVGRGGRASRSQHE